ENEGTLRKSPRLGPAVLGLRHLEAEEREAVRRQAAAFVRGLAADNAD
ncbi:MAG: hypothetical protein HC802_23580, partial [Caldilineaceae bacterium]|nr:hypothetical protein [Caldilineaceae bacterium]